MSIITVSRMYGSGGSDVAAGAARSLGWSLVDNAFVDSVAERLGITTDEVAAREERVPTLSERLADALALSSPEVLPPPADASLPPSEERLIDVTRRVIEEAVARGNAVLVGRGAQSALAARTDTLHVFCYAPHAALIANVAARRGIGEKEAEQLVDQINKERENYVRTYWKRSWSSHENYHICLNTQWLGIEEAANLVVQVARKKFGPQ